MNDRSGKKPAAKAVAKNSEDDSVDKIRDILFGNQMREVDKRFASLEKNLAGDLANLRNENALQIESLKNFLESEMEILGSKLAAEEKSRIHGDDDLDAKIQQQAKQIDKKLSELGKSLDKLASDINQKILKQAEDFGAGLKSQVDEMRERMDDHRNELATAKIDKRALSELLGKLALEINVDEGDR